MRAIIPLAGKGTRLRPHTYLTPKPLLKVGGRPVMSYILDDLLELGIREVIFIVGYLGDTIREYIAAEYPQIEPHYVVQEVQDGTAGAVKLAEPWADQDLLILFVDTLFDADLGMVKTLRPEYAGVLWAKEVEDYQRFGVIVTRPDQTMEKIVEKPKTPISKLANIGLYYIRDSALLFEGINEVLRNPKGGSGEYYLTDAFQYMVDRGARLLVAPVEGWYDCGKPDTLLDTNRHLLVTGRGGVDKSAQITGAELIEPVRIEEGVRIEGGHIGPNVTLGKGTRVVGSRLTNVIVGEQAVLEGVDLHDSLLGNWVQAKGLKGQVSLADHSEVVSD
jgi:glucose-1-phosphate thymidylyltransferase